MITPETCPHPDAAAKLARPEYFECARLEARISARQCLLNQGKADGLRSIGVRFMGRIKVCLDCPEGRRMVAYPDDVACFAPAAPLPASLPIQDKSQTVPAARPAKLPAWLKNATPAVRRDYLRSKEGP
jgi:hypothetical protein